MSSANSGEVEGERLDHIADNVSVQPFKSKAAIPPRGCRPLPEGYAEGQEGVHVHLRVEALSKSGGVGGISRNLCAVFVRADIDGNGAGKMRRVGEIGDGTDSHLRDVRHSMLIHIGKLVELPQGVRRELISSIVRLHPLNDCLRFWIEAPDFPPMLSGVHDSIPKDQELKSSGEAFGQRVNADVGESEIVDEVVEGGAEVVETVADNEAKLCRDWLGEFDVHELLTAFTIDMTDVSVRFSLSPLTNFRVKAVQVMGGPV